MKEQSPRRSKRLASTLLTVGMVSATLAAPTASLGAQESTLCGTAPAGYNVINSDASVIRGTDGPDFICAGPSDNSIRSLDGNDIIFSRGGNDNINSGAGNDRINSGAGNDVVVGGSGNDVISGGIGADKLTGGNGNDRINGDAGRDRLFGNKGQDTLRGNSGRDRLSGGNGDDNLGGGSGDDILNGGNQEDVLAGGGGNDVLRGQGHPDILRGHMGDDVLDGGNGLNIAIGGNGGDQCFNAAGANTDCEFLDGVELANPTQVIIATFPNEVGGLATITGQNWRPNPDFPLERNIDVSLAGISGRATIVDGRWAVTVAASAAFGVDISATNQSTMQILEQVVDTFEYNSRTQDLAVTGVPDSTIRVLVYDDADELIFVEQITFKADGTGSANFSEVDGLASMDISRQDSDGDIAVYLDVHIDPTATTDAEGEEEIEDAPEEIPDAA